MDPFPMPAVPFSERMGVRAGHSSRGGPLQFPAVGQPVALDSVPGRTTACVLLSVTSEA